MKSKVLFFIYLMMNILNQKKINKNFQFVILRIFVKMYNKVRFTNQQI